MGMANLAAIGMTCKCYFWKNVLEYRPIGTSRSNMHGMPTWEFKNFRENCLCCAISTTCSCCSSATGSLLLVDQMLHTLASKPQLFNFLDDSLRRLKILDPVQVDISISQNLFGHTVTSLLILSPMHQMNKVPKLGILPSSKKFCPPHADNNNAATILRMLLCWIISAPSSSILVLPR